MKSRLISLLAFILGLGLFAYVVRQTGWQVIGGKIRQVGWGFIAILILSFLRHWVRSVSWRRCMAPEQRRVGIASLLRARLAGEAAGDLTIGPLVAEPLRLVMLGREVPLAAGISSLSVENLTYAFSSGLMIVLGVTALLATIGLDESMRAGMQLALAVVMLLIAGSALAIARRWALLSGVAAWVASRLPAGVKPGFEGQIEKLRELESYILDFFATRPSDFLAVMGCQITFHLAGVGEIYLTLRLLGIDLSLWSAFILESVNRAINIAFVFVPGLIGVDEAGSGLMTGLLGWGATAGVTLAIVRKLRMLFWIAVGLIFLAAGGRKRPG